jgi:hypothetical protein
MKATSIIWRRTFPDSAPGTDGVAIFEGRIIGRVRLTELPHSLKWLWTITEPELAGRRAGQTRTAKCPRAGKPWTA